MHRPFIAPAASLLVVPWLLTSCSDSFDDTPAQDGGSGNTQDGSYVDGAAGAAGHDGGTGGTDGGASDTGSDADVDGAPSDAGNDTGVDGAPPDAGGDAEVDADAGGDAEVDADAGGEDVINEPYCDPTAEPSDDACVVHEDFGIFVSPEGEDGASCGTRTSPCASLARGMSRANAAGKRVYACAGAVPYAEAIVVDAALDGIAVYGGLDCDDWSYLPTTRTRVAPPAPSLALTIQNLSQGARFVDMHFASANAVSVGASSIAVRVVDSQAVILKRCNVTAGQGAAGDTGQPGTKGANGPAVGAAQAGKDYNPTGGLPQSGGAWPSASPCGSKGGNGGGAYVIDDGDPGTQGTPTTGLVSAAVGHGGAGGIYDTPNGGVGEPGTDGQAGNNGTAAPMSMVVSQGYAPGDGKPGTNGSTAQGGGGGGGAWSPGDTTAPTGGAGGMGGCGGTFGLGGKGGGASIGVLIGSSDVVLEACTIISAAGGRGGDGGDGGQGGTGSNGALGGQGGNDTGEGGNGGKGGDGGPGGSGSGGSGGPSYAVAVQGATPATTGSQLTHGSGGGKGLGGAAPGGVKAPDGSDGDAATIYEVP